jgi:hypothetical protein
MSKINQTRIKEIDRGFIALEVIGVLVIMALLALWGAEKYSEFLEEQEWIVSARHFSEFNEAAKHYIADHYDELLTQPKSTLNNALLIKKGYLQKGFSDKNPFGQQYVTGIVRNNQKRPPALQALTCSVNGENLTEKGMRRIAAQINGMGGFVDEKNLAIGAYSGWISQPKDFGLDCRYGHLAIALSSEILGSVLQESDRLYRFQVKHKPELNRMHTHIDMGGNNLNNTNAVNAKEGVFSKTVTANGDIKSQGGWLVTQDNKGWMNSKHGGGFYMTDKEWIRAVNNKSIYTGGQLKAGTVRADGRLSTGDFLQLEKVVVEGSSCPTSGLVSRDAKGAVLSCQTGRWTKTTGLGPVSYHKTNSGAKNIGSHEFCSIAGFNLPGKYFSDISCHLALDSKKNWILSGSPPDFVHFQCEAICIN